MGGGDRSYPDAALAETLSPTRASSEPLQRTLAHGELVGRYVIDRELAIGGMGVVYRAYDPELDRRVVIKLIRTGRTAEHNELARARLLREGQALAKLSHPNVVSVHDVGHFDDDVFVAMELVPGLDLTGWLAARPRTVAEIVAVFVQAAHGLAAAHRAGLVHRDVKPGNIVASDDGRVKVVDFGLAALDREAEVDPAISSVRLRASAQELGLRAQLTQAGAWIGTPCYMAPEQYDGHPATSRSDQFGFCVAMYEALHGELPFEGDTFPEYAARIARGELRPPRRADVPASIDAALRRGLAVDPAARWPSMDALASAIRLAPRPRRLAPWIAVAAVAAAGATLATWRVVRDGAATTRGACDRLDDELAARWSPTQAATMRARFVASGSPYARGAADRSIARLDEWGRAWLATRVAVCRETDAASAPSREARARCLDHRLDEIGELVRALAATDRNGVPRAVEVTSQLPSLAPCDDGVALLAAVPPPDDPALRAEVDALRAALTHATALEAAGKLGDALAAAAEAAAATEHVPYPPIQAEALALRGHLEIYDGEFDAALATLERAAELASVTHQDAVVAAALVDLVLALAEAGRGPEAIGAAAGARAAVSRSGDPVLDGKLRSNLASALAATGDLDGAAARLNEAIPLLEQALGPDQLDVASVLNRLGGVEERRGRLDEARAAYQRAITIAEQRLGPDHPWTAVTRANLCWLDGAAGKLEETRACQAEVVGVLEAALGDPHPQLAWALNDAALTDQRLGDLVAARAGFDRALAMWEATVGPDHPDVALALTNLGVLAVLDHDVARAASLCRRAILIVERTGGPGHADVIAPLSCLGDALVADAPRDALEPLDRARAVWRSAPGDPLELARIEQTRARALLALGRRADAIAAAREALARAIAGRPAADAAELEAAARAWLQRHAPTVRAGRPASP